MNCKIPFTKDIDFEKKLYEITSISLEHEIKTEGLLLKGNFIVSGDFKSHEVSVNKEAFSYILPFEIDLTEEIDTETVEFMIDDFTYQIVDGSILRVNIDFNVIASKKEIVSETTNDEELVFRDAAELFDDEVKPLEELDLESEVTTDEVENMSSEEIEEEELEDNREEVVEKKEVVKESEETIINSFSGVKDDYATYHIHMVSDGETVETICTMYDANIGILADYNDLSNLVSGDKLIIPEKNE